MRLLSCRLRSVRCHRDLRLQFGPGLTVIGGPNESGKSTLLEALHRALFLKATATGAPVESLRSRQHAGHPEVGLCFEAHSDQWTLLKRFSGSSGTVRLQPRTSGRTLDGLAAEEHLAQLLAVEEMLGSRQAGNALPNRWAHLWVMQGRAGEDPLGTGGTAYELEALLRQLDQRGGGVLQSPLDQRVGEAVDALVEESYTSRGIRKHSPLWCARQALETAESNLQQAIQTVNAYERASGELTELCDRLRELSERTLPDLKRLGAELRTLENRRRGYLQAIALSEERLAPIHMRRDGLQADAAKLDRLATEAAERAQVLSRGRDELRQQEEALAAGEQRLRTLQARLKGFEEQRAALEREGLQLQREEALARHRLEQRRLQQQRARLMTRIERRRSLESQLRTLPPIGDASVHRLRQLHHRVVESRSRMGAMAMGLELLRSDQPVFVVELCGEGEGGAPVCPLETGDQRRFDRPVTLQVGDGTALLISPGGPQALERLRSKAEAGERALHKGLRDLGVPSLEAAELVALQRTTLTAARDGLGDLQSDDEERCSLDERLTSLEAELRRSDEGTDPGTEAEPGSLSGDRDDIHSLQQQLDDLTRGLRERRRTYKPLAQACGRATEDVESERQQLTAMRKRQLEMRERLARLSAETKTHQVRRQELLKRHGDRERLAQSIAKTEKEAQSEEQALQLNRADLAQAERDGPAHGGEAISARIERAEAEQTHLSAAMGAARERCQQLAGSDPYAALEQALADRDAAQELHRQQLERAEAHRLLQLLFHKGSLELSTRYTRPLAESVEAFLSPLLHSEQSACQLSFDRANGFSGLQLRRERELFDFQALSGGMRGQLAAALRLAMADVLRNEHDGCLPLIFDDAFTNSDPQRVPLVHFMLEQAVKRGLQVIILSCEPSVYRQLPGLHLNLQDLNGDPGVEKEADDPALRRPDP